MRGEWGEDQNSPSDAEIVYFDSQVEALAYLHNQRHVYLEGAPIYDDE